MANQASTAPRRVQWLAWLYKWRQSLGSLVPHAQSLLPPAGEEGGGGIDHNGARAGGGAAHRELGQPAGDLLQAAARAGQEGARARRALRRRRRAPRLLRQGQAPRLRRARQVLATSCTHSSALRHRSSSVLLYSIMLHPTHAFASFFERHACLF
jgi:hypothetical protein